MFREPLSNRPTVTNNDILAGYITRYFIKSISSNKVIEVDKKQYDVFKNSAFYESLDFKWVIGGYNKDITTSDGHIIYGAGHRNEVSLDFYDKKMSGLKRILRNPLEYFSGKTI